MDTFSLYVVTGYFSNILRSLSFLKLPDISLFCIYVFCLFSSFLIFNDFSHFSTHIFINILLKYFFQVFCECLARPFSHSYLFYFIITTCAGSFMFVLCNAFIFLRRNKYIPNFFNASLSYCPKYFEYP